MGLNLSIQADRRLARARQRQRWIALHDLQRSFADDTAMLHEDQVIGKPLDFRHVVTDVEYRKRKPCVQSFEERQNLVLGRTVQCRQRLVHQQQFGLRQQGTADGDPLPLAARQMVRRSVEQLCQAEQLDHLIESDAILARYPCVVGNAVKQIAFDREVGKQARFLKHVADRPLVRLSKCRLVLPDIAIDRAGTSRQVLQAGQTARHGCLAAAGRAENRGDARCRNREACVQ